MLGPLCVQEATRRCAGFSPSGRTLADATSSDLTPWTRRTAEEGPAGAAHA